MANTNIKSYSVKSSKSGHHIPVINDVHLHSAYNPMRESESFIENNRELIQSKPNLLILGLGFGYHVNLANKILSDTQFTSHQIVVIEPVKRIFTDCLNLNLLDRTATIVYAGESINHLYENNDFTKFLLKGPSVLAHPATFNLHKEYFKEFLGFKASTDINTTAQNIQDKELKNYLLDHSDYKSLDALTEIMNTSNHFLDNEYDHLLLAFKHLVASSNQREAI